MKLLVKALAVSGAMAFVASASAQNTSVAPYVPQAASGQNIQNNTGFPTQNNQNSDPQRAAFMKQWGGLSQQQKEAIQQQMDRIRQNQNNMVPPVQQPALKNQAPHQEPGTAGMPAEGSNGPVGQDNSVPGYDPHQHYPSSDE